MKLCKYYSLDECQTRDAVFEELDKLQADEKLDYLYIDDDEVIKISESLLTTKEIKSLKHFLKENDVLEYTDYEEYLEEEEYDDADDDDYNDDDSDLD
jgi:hypothetical protein